MFEVRVDRGYRAEFVAFSSENEDEAQKEFDIWKQEPNVDKVGLFENGNLCQPLYIRKEDETN